MSQQRQQQQQHKWGYSNDLIGPSEWPKYFHTGQYQSPINILVNNCRHVTQSTCCHQHSSGEAAESYQVKQKIQRDHHQRSVHEARIHDRLKSSLRIGPNRRAHLDSVGEDHHRSLSASSSGSQNSSKSTSSSSPGRKGNNNYDDDDDNDENDNVSSGSSNNSSDYDQDGFEDEEEKNGRQMITSSSSSSSSSSSETTTTIRYNEYKRQQQQPNTCCVTQVQNTRHCESRKKIFLGYPRYLNTMQLCNTGHNWQVNLPPEIATHTRKCFHSIFSTLFLSTKSS